MLTFTFNASGQLTLTMTPSSHSGYNVSCFGGRDGSIDLTVSGGSGNYNFQWSNNLHTEDISDLQAGYYHVTVQDLNPPNENGDAEITLTQPDQLQLHDPIISSYPNGYCISLFGACNGSIQISPDGGATPYSYLWHDGSTNHNRWSLCQGQYSVTITDANGCSLQSEHYYISEPPPSDWSMSGNSSTNPSSQYLGTNDNTDFVFKTNSIERFRLRGSGTIETASPLKIYSSSTNNYRLMYVDTAGILRLAVNQTNPCYVPLPDIWLYNSCNSTPDVFLRPPFINVGIGTTQPVARLHVESGDIFVHGVNNFANATDLAMVKLGDANNYIASEKGYGMRIGITNNSNFLNIYSGTGTGDGTVGIGIDPAASTTYYAAGSTTNYKLLVGGALGAKEVWISLGDQNYPWPDYVFNEDYKTESLKVIHDYFFKYKHLRNMPSANDIKKNGAFNLGEVQTQSVKEIEEIYLQLFKLSDRITELEKQNAELIQKFIK